MTKSPVVEAMGPADWDAVVRIYREGIATGAATFETAVPSWESWDAAHLPGARLVARESSAIVGWAALSPVSRRAAYAGVAEVSAYVATACRGRGVGRALLERLISESEAQGIWTLQAVVFSENAATLALHKGCGFREVGRRERISKLRGEWRDTILLERRSTEVGID
ncbi:MAG TPA: GNAT family N-acetyltransferase [Pyrinomonadaceae bacterium]